MYILLKLSSIIILMMLLTGEPCFAVQKMQFEDDKISVEFPAAWEVVTQSNPSEEVAESLGMTKGTLERYFYWKDPVFLATKTKNGTNVVLELNYHVNPSEDGPETPYTSKQNLMQYHKEYGEDIKLLGLNLLGDEIEERGKVKVFQSNFGLFVKVPITFAINDDWNDKADNEDVPYKMDLYYMPLGGDIILFLVYSPNLKTKDSQLAEGETIINSFSDTGFYKPVGYYSDGDYYDEDDTSIDYLLLFVVFVFICFIAYEARRKRPIQKKEALFWSEHENEKDEEFISSEELEKAFEEYRPITMPDDPEQGIRILMESYLQAPLYAGLLSKELYAEIIRSFSPSKLDEEVLEDYDPDYLGAEDAEACASSSLSMSGLIGNDENSYNICFYKAFKGYFAAFRDIGLLSQELFCEVIESYTLGPKVRLSNPMLKNEMKQELNAYKQNLKELHQMNLMTENEYKRLPAMYQRQLEEEFFVSESKADKQEPSPTTSLHDPKALFEAGLITKEEYKKSR